MITVVGQTIEAKNEEGARHGFDVFETLLILVGFSLVTEIMSH
jgi:hypothetical protein